LKKKKKTILRGVPLPEPGARDGNTNPKNFELKRVYRKYEIPNPVHPSILRILFKGIDRIMAHHDCVRARYREKAIEY
jgi:hypothetical protein